MLAALQQKLKEIEASWSLYVAIGTFFLYLLGYMVLRFQLSTWGVATDLPVLDERYFFAGARFLVYLVTSVVSTLLLGAPLVAVWWLLNQSPRFLRWRKSWNCALCGIVFAVLFIQLVERKCFTLMDSLLIQPNLSGAGWLQAVLCDDSPNYEPLFFVILIVGVVITIWLLLEAQSSSLRKPRLEAMLVFLLIVEVLLVPVNYGIVISTKELPEVTQFAPAKAWLVWEGKEKTTFLVVDKERALISIPNGDIKKLEIKGMTQIFSFLFPGRPL